MAHRTVNRRVAAIEARRAARPVPIDSTPYWSELHGMWMVDVAGIIVPNNNVSIDEWAPAAAAQQAQLLATGVPVDREVVVARERIPKARPAPGPVRVVHRATGEISTHASVDARELVASGSYALVRDPT